MAVCSIGIAAGVIWFVALVKGLVLRRRLGGGCHGYGGGGFHRGYGGGWRGRGGIGRSFWLRWLFHRLDTTPGQEREIHGALEELRDRARDAKSGLVESRDNIGRAVAGETFDDAAFEAVTARFDATGEMMKDAFASALKRIHAILDTKQRERLAEIVSKGGFDRFRGGGGGWGGPYRQNA